MKRKFLLGICILLLIVILFSTFLFRSISSIYKYQTVKDKHNEIVTTYLEILSKTQNALILLYQYKSGLKSEFDSIVNIVLDSDELIAAVDKKYAENEFSPICNECHNSDEKIIGLSRNLFIYQDAFKTAVSPVITSLDEKQVLAYQDEAIREGNKIIDSITDMWFKLRKMNIDLKTKIEAEEKQTQITIGSLLLITVGASGIILFILLRSISHPVNKLVRGLDLIRTGNYDSKVDITSNDEFGHLADHINILTKNLKQTTQEKEAAMEELRQLNCDLERRIHRKTEELKKAHDNLLRVEGLAVAGTVSASIAHELSTPLSTLRGYCEFINSKMPKDLGLTKYINAMQEEVDRCSQVIRGMLNLTRISDEEKSYTDINATITEILFFVSLHADCMNISVKKELDPTIPHITANGLAIRQAFMNIVINAIQAMPDGGELRITSSLMEAGNNIKVTISDTGNGICESDLKNIFKSFYTTKKSGTGLGLAICYAIIQAHDGEIIVRSKEGQGTTFDVIIPVQVSKKA